EIATGTRRDGYLEIVEGLSGGDTIICNAALGQVARVIAEEESATPTVAGPTADGTDDTQQSKSSTDENAVSLSRQPLEDVGSEPKVLAAAAKLAESQDGAGKKRDESMPDAPAIVP